MRIIDGPAPGETKEPETGIYAFLIEMPGPAYLAAKECGGHIFYWTTNCHDAIRFQMRQQAEAVMMAVRQLRGDLFPACLPYSPRPVEHKFM